MKMLQGLMGLLLLAQIAPATAQDYWTDESAEAREIRMEWWRDARFGLFIHWGLYAIPAGEWNGETNHAEWIRTTAQIPLPVYDRFVHRFNPLDFDADQWVRAARAAGMRYIIITSKHHDGFCLWPSDQTDYDVAATPYPYDILDELKAACERHGVELGFYHSIMDWHHPDYLPRRDWETERPTEGAEYERYVEHMKAQLRELIERYDPAVLWFDGEWEGTWSHEHGIDLYEYVRSLKPDIIINNRVDKGRQGMEGLTREGDYRGDFGTPEQEIPATGLPGVDWETCMTMNDHWGWNRNDENWKTSEDLIRKLVDIASKGGNFLLNIGPRADGAFPEASLDRLESIGEWMEVYGDSIYDTSASPVAQPEWGRITTRTGKQGTMLFLHVFDWPADGRLPLALRGDVESCYRLDAPGETFIVDTSDEGLSVELTGEAPNSIDSVLVLELAGPATPVE